MIWCSIAKIFPPKKIVVRDGISNQFIYLKLRSSRYGGAWPFMFPLSLHASGFLFFFQGGFYFALFCCFSFFFRFFFLVFCCCLFCFVCLFVCLFICYIVVFISSDGYGSIKINKVSKPDAISVAFETSFHPFLQVHFWYSTLSYYSPNIGALSCMGINHFTPKCADSPVIWHQITSQTVSDFNLTELLQATRNLNSFMEIFCTFTNIKNRCNLRSDW